MKFKFIYLLNSIYKSCDSIHFFHGMFIEIILNNKIQIFFFSNKFTFLRGKKYVSIYYWKEFKFKLSFFIWTKS
jgi:hypothetical protein